MHNETGNTTLHPFLYTIIMDVVQLQQITYPEYEKREPGYAATFLQAYIYAFKTPRDRKISHILLKEINRLSTQHMSEICGEYRTIPITFKLSRELYELPNNAIGENITYSSTEKGLNEFVDHWLLNQNQPHPRHTLFFQKDSESICGASLHASNGQIVVKEALSDMRNLNRKQCTGWIKKWFHSDYRCIIHVSQDFDYITTEMQNIFDLYHQDIEQAAADHEKIRIIAKYIQLIEQLHPFPDGNIRTCYIVLNKLLSDCNLSLTILLNPNRLDCCDLDEIVRSIQEGQIIYQYLLKNQDAQQFVVPLGKPILTNMYHLIAQPHDLHMPELVQSFCAWVLNRPCFSALSMLESITPHLTTLEQKTQRDLMKDIFETNNFALLLRRACFIGQYEIIEVLLSFQLILAIDINEPAKNGKTAKDFLKNSPDSSKKQNALRLFDSHGGMTQAERVRKNETNFSCEI